jgi:hypothetical protein
LLLACVAMTVRLVVGDGEAGTGPPIQVRLVDDPTIEIPLTLVAPPQLFEREVEQPVESTPEPIAESAAADAPAERELTIAPAATAETTIEPPPLLEPAEADNSAATTADIPAADATRPLVEVESPVASPSVEAASEPVDAAVVKNTAQPEQPWTSVEADASSAPSPPIAQLPRPYARRSATERLRWAQQQGGSTQTEAAVAAALKWLADAQSADGRWDASRFGAGVEMAVLGQNRGGAGADADVGVSALAVLAFLGAGNTHQHGDYPEVVRGGLEFLVNSQTNDGNLASRTGLYAQMYCHSMGTFALAEALAMTGDSWLEPAVRRAAEYSIRAQHPATGGWRYRVGDTGDTSQLGWQLMALWSAERAGIEVPPQTWSGAERFLRSVRRGNRGGLASYRPDGPASASMTAEALYCRQLVNQLVGGDADSAAVAEATAQVLAAPPDPSRLNLYYWYYATLALHHQQQASDRAMQAWQTWNSALTNALLDAQVVDGLENGSWNPDTVWGGYGGRVYTTAVAALCLEVYYRYAPLPSDSRWMATQPRVRRLPQR